MIVDKKTEEKDMTIKQRKWMREYIKSGNASDAAMKVYHCKNRESAAVMGHENSSIDNDHTVQKIPVTTCFSRYKKCRNQYYINNRENK